MNKPTADPPAPQQPDDPAELVEAGPDDGAVLVACYLPPTPLEKRFARAALDALRDAITKESSK